MKHSVVAIIGTGAVGSTTAYTLMLQNIAAEIMLVDINENYCTGQVFDLSDALSSCSTSIITKCKTEEIQNADIIIIAAGEAQKPGQSREDLLKTNRAVISTIIDNLQRIDPTTLMILVTNPVDLLTDHAIKCAELSKNNIFGSGTIIDSKRLCGFIAQKSGVAQESIHAYVLGEHGDSQFPVWSTAHIDTIPLLKFPGITEKILDDCEQKTKQKAYDIISYKGATQFGVATCIADICRAIIFNENRVLPLSCYSPQFNVCLSLPCVLGNKGIKQILQPDLDDHEQLLLEKSAARIQQLLTTE